MKCESGKVRYLTEESARSSADHRESVVGHPLNVYHCRLCDGWHMTRFPMHLIVRLSSASFTKVASQQQRMA